MVAIDINPEAQFLLDLKLTAIEKLDLKTYLNFIGFSDNSKQRHEIFNELSNYLHNNSLIYWKDQESDIEKGILNTGHFERYIGKLRPLTKWFLGKGFYDGFLNEMDGYRNFPRVRWNFFLKVLSSRHFFKLTGNKDIAFNSKDCMRKVIPEGLRKTVQENFANKSFMFNLLFKGHLREMDTSFIPPSLQAEILERIRQKLVRQEIEMLYCTNDLKTAIKENIETVSANTFFSFSDILSFESIDYLFEILLELKNTGMKNLNGVFRTFLRNDIKIEKFPRGIVNSLVDVSEREMTNMYKAYYFSI